MTDRRRFLWLAGLGTVTAACTGGGSRPGTTIPSTVVEPAGPPDWAALRERLSGELVLPADPGYDQVRLPFNELFAGRRPAAVARCATPSDVQACVDLARTSGVPVAARSGGHSYAGYSTPEQGLVVDLGGLARVDVRPDGTAVIGSGARLIDVYTALAAHGRALPAGTCPTVGIAGLTLGGGLGVHNRLHGLTCDRLRSARVVLTDGTTATAADGADSDLFWALRGGGGGNFGIVTEFTFDTVPAQDVTVFSLPFPPAAAADVLGGWQEWFPSMPDELWSSCSVSAGSPPSARVGGCFVGRPGRLAGLLDDLERRTGVRSGGRFAEAMDHLEAMRYFAGCSQRSQAQCRMQDPAPFVGSSRIAQEPLADPAAVVALLALPPDVGRGQGINVMFDSLGGAVGRVPPDATAFPHRLALASVQVYAEAADPGPARREVTRVQDGLSRLVGRGAYVNYIDPDQADWAQSSYGANLPRLRELAARYDPNRVFRFAQSISA